MLTPPQSEAGRFTRTGKLTSILGTAGIYVIIILLLLVGLGIRQLDYLSLANLRSILQAVSLLGMCCAGLAFVVFSGNMNDMSLPMTMALSGMMAIQLIPYGIVVSVLGGIVAGTLVGVINGIMIGKFRAHPIIWTLAFNLVLSGLVRAAWGGSQIYPDTIAGQNETAQATAETFNLFARTYYFDGALPLMVVVMFIMFVLAQVIFSRTTFGNKLRIVGSQYEVARMSGINTERMVMTAFVLCSLCASVAGIFYASLTKIGAYSNGEGYDFRALTAVLLGGMTLAGGKGTMVGVFGGVLVLGMLTNIMTLIGVPTFNQYVVQGVVFLFIVWLNNYLEEKRGHA
ncbi:MAG TPA: ABC transporter permease [Clostridiaceae bacterium]|nr:ABC transporter permease [Clostridiaceae bacterium]